MSNNDTSMNNGVNNGFNNMNGMDPNQNNLNNNGMNPEGMIIPNGTPDLQGMSLGNVDQSNGMNQGMNGSVGDMNTNLNVNPMNMQTPMNNVPTSAPVAPDFTINNNSVPSGGMEMNTGNPSPTINNAGVSFDSFTNPEPPVQNLEVNNAPMNAAPNIGTMDMNQSVPNASPTMNLGDTNFGNTNMASTPTFNDPSNMNMNMNMSSDMNANMATPQMGMNNPMGGSPMASDPFGANNMGQPMTQPMNSNPFDPNINGMNNNMFAGVPTPPPIDNNNNKKGSKISKTTIIIIVVLLIAVIGAAVYFVLNKTKTTSKGTITLNDLQLELGEELSTNISDYGTISGFDSSSCTLDTSKVDIHKMGAYDYTVTCGTTSKSAKIMLQDKVAPDVVVKELSVFPGTNVKLEDFIVSCKDASNCSYALEDTTQDLTQLVQNEGTYSLNLIVSDDYDNQTTVAVTLKVTNSAPVKFMYCTPASTNDTTLNAVIETSYNYGIDNDDVLASIQKVQTYTFENQEDYLAAKPNYENSATEVVTFDDDEFIITITSDLTTNELATEFNVNPFPTDYSELRQFNLNQGISCKNR